MVSKQWYEILFENYAQKYDQERFTQGTLGECDFLEQELKYDKTLKILDVGCGTGRHAIELTQRGYAVTGIDLSASQINRAKAKAQQAHLNIDFLVHDARNLPFRHEFDVAIMLCEGGFPLMETDEMNYEILKNVAQSLKKNGKFIFTTLNGLFPLHHSIQKFTSANKTKENAILYDNRFDLITFRDYSTIEFEDDLGNQKTIKCNQRFYIPSEITWLLKSLGFKQIDIFGAKLGAFSRTHMLTVDDFEMLVIAEK